MLKQVPVNVYNIHLIKRLWKNIFPKETMYYGFEGLDCFSYSLVPNNIGNHRYYIYFDDEIPVGISGLYEEPDELPKESAWLGWFGVVEEYRNKGYGKQIIQFFENEAKKYGYKFCRIYTEDSPDNKAVDFYKKLGYTFEKYDREVPKDYEVEKIQVCSKSICEEPLKLWNNRPFYFD